MAQHKAAGSCRQGGRPRGKADGVKIFEGGIATAGSVVVRQRGKGTVFFAGVNCLLSRDHTVHAKIDGRVFFYDKNNRKYIGIFPENLCKTKGFSSEAKQNFVSGKI